MVLLLVVLLVAAVSTQTDPAINSMTYINDFALGRQTDLNETFDAIAKKLTIPDITYTERIGKTYRIYDLQPVFYVIDSKQTATFTVMNQVNVSGATVRINYKFNWEKKQLGASVRGTAEGAVLSDRISFLKSISIIDDEPAWVLDASPNISFANSFTVNNVKPYNQNDSDVLFIMFNKDLGHTTGKQIITESINALYQPLLNVSVQSHSEEIQVSKTLVYTYNDYRGQLKVTYKNHIATIRLDPAGLVLRFIQDIPDTEKFDYGQDLPDSVQDPKIYGGHQSFMNIELLKSTAQYALNKGFFDVLLSQEEWQSRAFQFCTGDLSQAIPSLKPLPPTTQVTGKCKAQNDNSYNMTVANERQFRVDINYSCTLDMSNVTGFAQFSVITTSYVDVQLLTRTLQFKLAKLTARANFTDVPNYKVQNLPFANFLVQETVARAVGSTVFGTGYPTSSRLYPNLKIQDRYLFLYDSSLRSSETLQSL